MKTLLKVSLFIDAVNFAILATYALSLAFFGGDFFETMFSVSVLPGIIVILKLLPTLILTAVALIVWLRGARDKQTMVLIVLEVVACAVLMWLWGYWLVSHQV